MNVDDPGLNWKLTQFRNAMDVVKEKSDALDLEMVRRVAIRDKAYAAADKKGEELINEEMSAFARQTRKDQARIKRLEYENKKLKQQVDLKPVESKQEQVGLDRAKTLAIFDSILFAIENWAEDDSPAPDFTLAAQACLFPLVYEQIGKGNKDYYVTEVPPAAMEIVRRGREYVHAFRVKDDTSIFEPDTWAVISGEVHDWWINDALPLIYGARDPDWDTSSPYPLEDMMKWRHMPASRALEFPLIYDGMELVKQYGDSIRDSTGLPVFNKNVLTTRIKAHE